MSKYSQFLIPKTELGPIVPITTGAATLTVPVNEIYRHSFAGVAYYSDANGDTPVVPTTGTETYLLTTTVKPDSQQAFTDNVINSADESQVSWAANVTSVECTLDSVDVATHARLIVTGNVS